MGRMLPRPRQDCVLDSVTSAALTSALNGLSLRQQPIADNIANVNTPGYHAKRVQFEDALAASVAWAVKLLLGHHGAILSAAVILGLYGIVYFGIAYLLRVDECRLTLKRFLR